MLMWLHMWQHSLSQAPAELLLSFACWMQGGSTPQRYAIAQHLGI